MALTIVHTGVRVEQVEGVQRSAKASYAGSVSRRSGAVEATGVIGTVDAVGSRRRIVSHDAMTEQVWSKEPSSFCLK